MLPKLLLFLLLVLSVFISCKENKSNKFLGTWISSSSNLEVKINRMGQNFTIEIDGSPKFPASYNSDQDKIELNIPDRQTLFIFYNKATEQILRLNQEFVKK